MVTAENENVGHIGGSGFAASGRTLAWWTRLRDVSELRWLDRSGTSAGVLGAAGSYAGSPYELSPDDKYLAVAITDDIWVMDVASGGKQRLTDHPAIDAWPRWSPDGERIAFASHRGPGGNQNLYAVSITRPDDVQTLAEIPLQIFPVGWTPSGRFAWIQPARSSAIAASAGPARFTLRGIMMNAPDGGEPTLVNANVAFTPALSRDGTTIAYPRSLAGRWEIQVDGLLSPGSPRRLSWNGSTMPSPILWRADGRELIFRSGDDVFGVPVQTGDTITLGTPVRLFESRGTTGLAVTRDGSRFLVRVPTTSTPASLTVVLNWSPDQVK